jgi:hypothetical protein
MAETLRRNYPGEWVALELGEQDKRTGLTRGTIIAHNVTAELTVAPVETYRAEHPEAGIHFFCTSLAPAPSRPSRRER